MLKFWIYIIFLAVLAAIGLAIGSANDTVVSFDFMVVKADVSVATVLVLGVAFGLVVGIWLSLMMCFRFWRSARAANSALAALKKEQKQKIPERPEEKQAE